jgi:uncharacterized protein (DUF433 family)
MDTPLIVKSPDILGGTPVFQGTRVPVQNLVDYLAAGDTIESFLGDFPSVTREQVLAFLDLAGETAIANAHEDIA